MDVYLTEWVRYLAAQSWQIAALTVAVALATWILRQRSAHVRYLLWLIVLAKCLVPPLVAVPLKILPEKAAPVIPAAVPVAESAIEEPAAIDRAQPVLVARPGPGLVRQTVGADANQAAQRRWNLATWAGLTWVGGAGIFLALNLLRALRGQRWLRRRRRPLPDEIKAEMETLLSACGRSALPPIWIVDGIGQPFVWGLACGSIYVPASFPKIRDAAQRRHVLAHELAHVRRCDAAVNLLQTIANGLFWFHPCVWWANRQIRREREKCCDEMAVAQLGTEARDYCNAVVETLASAETSARSVPSLAVAGPARNLEERIRAMLRPGKKFYRRPSPAAIACTALLTAVAVPTALVVTARPRAQSEVDELLELTARDEGTTVATGARGGLPTGWSLTYDDGITGGGTARHWPGQMANDLASLEVIASPADPTDETWRSEDYRFEILSADDKPVGTLDIRRNERHRETAMKILRPGSYALRYRRAGGKHPDNFWMHSGPFRIDLSRPGMYELRFAPKLGRARITGSLGGCYALNFERLEPDGSDVTGTIYQYPPQRYMIDGLPAGQYRLSASRQSDGSNIFISQAQASVAGGATVTMDMPAPPEGTCSLKGKLLGKRQVYTTPWQTHPQSPGRWFVLLRNPGSGPIVKTPAYQTLTMDSRYVVWSDGIVQETEDTAVYSINGIAPGEYTVTAIEDPYYQGYMIERQQSKPLILRAGEAATLDFDLRATSGRAENAESASRAVQGKPGRVARFPSDRSVGQLQIQEAGATRELTWFVHSAETEEPPWEDLGEARGDIRVPGGKRVALTVNRFAQKDLSWLAQLGPDDLYSLSLPAPATDRAKASDACMPLVARLTGLKRLNLYQTAITNRGLRHITKLQSLEYLDAPRRMSDSGLAHVAELPSLKGLYIGAGSDSAVTDAGLRHLAKLTSLEELYLRGERMGDAGLAHLRGLPRLEYLALYGSRFTDQGMVHVKEIPSLRILSFYQGVCRITDAGLAHIAEMPRLELLMLRVTGPVTDEGIRYLSQMPSLRKLHVDSPLISDRSLEYLGQIKTLEYLTLPQDQHGITDVGLVHLSQLANLRCLHVARIHFNDPAMNTEYYTDRGLQALANCRLLEELHVGSPGITDAGLDHIAKLTGLKKLMLFGCDHVTDAGLAKLTALEALTDLYVAEADATLSGINQLDALEHLARLTVFELRRDGAILDLSGMANLERLSLSFARKSGDAFTDADLACLANLKTLRWLQIGPHDYTDRGLSHLAGLTSMERLNLGGSGLTDEGLKHLTNMKKLDLLSITGPFDAGKLNWSSGGHFTDEALRTLERFKQLTLLEIYSDSTFSDAAVQRLREALPNLYTLRLNDAAGQPPGLGTRVDMNRPAGSAGRRRQDRRRVSVQR
ncbi:MAG: hypothetical protein JSW27_25405 [Phycisphaerales bacterium]|nr:MAG: hypothetical protein JSW27_25405 [Phycisphaerales bacterium]